MSSPSLGLTLISPGTLSLLQDAGRFGMTALGLTQGGPMDEHSFAWANALVGNPRNSTVIEHHVGGLIMHAQQACTLAVTGAVATITVNGKPVPSWQALALKAGDELSIGYATQGLRFYIAVAGGFAVTPQFGSTATVMREGIGGLQQDGAKLQAGACLALGTPSLTQAVASPCQQIQQYTLARSANGEPLPLRVLLGYQGAALTTLAGSGSEAYFSASEQARFFLSPYQVSTQGDRMGIKLQGAAIRAKRQQLLSEGISLGAIQIPPDGQPIVLLQDRQTLGGYPKLGNVLSLDCWALAQASAGALVQFVPIDSFESHNALCLYHAGFAPR